MRLQRLHPQAAQRRLGRSHLLLGGLEISIGGELLVHQVLDAPQLAFGEVHVYRRLLHLRGASGHAAHLEQQVTLGHDLARDHRNPGHLTGFHERQRSLAIGSKLHGAVADDRALDSPALDLGSGDRSAHLAAGGVAVPLCVARREAEANQDQDRAFHPVPPQLLVAVMRASASAWDSAASWSFCSSSAARTV